MEVAEVVNVLNLPEHRKTVDVNILLNNMAQMSSEFTTKTELLVEGAKTIRNVLNMFNAVKATNIGSVHSVVAGRDAS
jgi:hypothetical protein